MESFKKRFIGDSAFYSMMLKVMLPIIIQNGITNFVSLLDNLMVGRLGTEQMSGVAIVNQLMMVYGISIFGVVSGAAIFSTQYIGQRNNEGVRNTFRFKFIIGIVVTALWILVFFNWDHNIINLFLSEDGTGSLALTMDSALSYLHIMLIGLIPYTISQIYSSTLRETGETFVPMIASSVAVGVNLVFNYILIFGHFGAPRMGVAGAATATAMSRFIELLIVVIYTHTHTARFPFMVGAYRSLHVPMELVKQITIKGTPLLINETCWSLGQAILTQCYSTKGLSAVAAFNINSTVANLFNVVFIAVGSSISIIVGHELGAGHLDKAYDTNRKLTFTAVVSSAALGVVMFIMAPLFPLMYNTSTGVRALATTLLRINACFMPMFALYNSTYFAVRTGGKTFITFLFDSFYQLVITCGAAFILTRFFNIDAPMLYFLVLSTEIFKCAIGLTLVVKKIWLVNLVEDIE